MKYLISVFVLAVFGAAYADAPSTSCPTGFIAVVEEYMTLADTFCPAGYTSAGTATSCLVSAPSGSCMMYVPVGMSYNDGTGSYQYDKICPLM